jgi:hypothetical protein
MTQLTIDHPLLGILVARGYEPAAPSTPAGYAVIVALADGGLYDKVSFEKNKSEWLAAESMLDIPGLVSLHVVFAAHGDLAVPNQTLTDLEVARLAASRLADPVVFTPELHSWRSVQRFSPAGENTVYCQLMHLDRDGDHFVVRVGGVEQRSDEPEGKLDNHAAWSGSFEVRLPCEEFRRAYEGMLRFIGRSEAC